MIEKVLITNDSHAEIPIINNLKKKGYYVVSTGYAKENLGRKLVDKHIPSDFSNKELILKIAIDEKIDYIISGANDFGYITAAYVAEKLGLPGHDKYETAIKIHNKIEFRNIMLECGVKVPKFMSIHSENDLKNIDEYIRFPLMIKAVDLTGGKGVNLCYNNQDILKAYDEAIRVTRKNEVVAEEYISGSNHGATFILKNKRVIFHMIDNEEYYLNKFLVSGAYTPSSVPQCAIYHLINDVEKIANHMDLVDGLFHLQFILQDEKYPVIIDPCRRIPGDLYVYLPKYSLGIDYIDTIVDAEFGKEIVNNYNYGIYNYIAREVVMPSKNGIFNGVKFNDDISKRIIYKMDLQNLGDKINDYYKDKICIVFLKFNCYNEMKDILSRFRTNVDVIVE